MKAVISGILAASLLIAVYLTIVTLVSGSRFAVLQFRQFWYYVVTLAIGFGIQVGLYGYLKTQVKNVSAGVVATTGTTSTAAMISCCAHYLVNVLPLLGTVGIVTIISQYQVELFWVGLAFNFAGIVYMLNKVVKVRKRHEE